MAATALSTAPLVADSAELKLDSSFPVSTLLLLLPPLQPANARVAAIAAIIHPRCEAAGMGICRYTCRTSATVIRYWRSE